MIIRNADDRDRFKVVALLRESHAAAGFTFPFQAAVAERLFKQHLGDANACCLVLGDLPSGLLMARTFDHPFGAGRWAKETVWYVAPGSRGRGTLAMLDAYETWAREQGCVTIGMASLATNDVSRIYERRGYAAAETHFVKAL
ncbi:GNAT family N-acetyltransferase [Mesorhizobium sp. BE184]|uniref:GNAT family N-acetyltransferase n=1 Tax=Mesorhizobium sp. BE184 TaxID=2817714 RepID=UPI0028585652|nr:GNAT family N-acetyltransferase [Mesorhizobium sp. BE184]MDR7032928.1 GNAT superfamily N-acetyltransferase [Mesorhizobium sp. BE184]